MYSVRLTPLEYEVLKDKCEKSGMEFSQFVRSAMKGKNAFVIEGIPQMIVALNRIGNNINQIAGYVVPTNKSMLSQFGKTTIQFKSEYR